MGATGLGPAGTGHTPDVGPGGRPPGLAHHRRTVAVGLAADIGLRGGMVGIGSALALAAAAVAVVVVLGPHRERVALAVAAVAFATCLALWTSPWVVILDWFAALALLALAATSAPDRPLVGQTIPSLVARSSFPWAISPATGLVEPIEVAKTLHARPKPDRSERAPRSLPRHTTAVLRGLLLAAPIIVVLGLLLGSADAVFASFFDVPTPSFAVSLEALVLHAFLFCVGAGAVVALVGGERIVRPFAPSRTRPLGPIEGLVVLVGLAALYALFSVAQVVAAVGGDERVQETTGLTYAEYARTGFFQLLWAAGITLVVLLGIRALTREATPRQEAALRATSALCCLLTLVLVGAAIHRLGVYRDAYGLTMLRLACTTFAWALGVAFVLLAVRMVQRRTARDWLPVAVAATSLLALGWWNVSQPEAHVARSNLDRAVATGDLDVDYADGMSDDAIPTLLAGLDRLPDEVADDLRQRLCEPPAGSRFGYPDDEFESGRTHVEPEADGSVEVGGGWAGWNRSRRAAADAVEACATG